jgi:hypothetical protein
MRKMDAEILFTDIAAALPAIAELHRLGFEIEVRSWTDDYEGFLVTPKVWLVARGRSEEIDFDFLDRVDDIVARFGGDVVEAGAATPPVEETRSVGEIARLRSLKCIGWEEL